MPTTPNLALPYPQATDPADVPHDIQALAAAIDNGMHAWPVAPPPLTACRMYTSSSPTPAIGGFSNMFLNAVTFDAATNMADAANFRILIPAAGVYHFAGAVEVIAGATTQDVIAAIYVNGTERSRGMRIAGAITVGQTTQVTVGDILSLNQGDAVGLYVYVGYLASTTPTSAPGIKNYLAAARIK